MTASGTATKRPPGRPRGSKWKVPETMAAKWVTVEEAAKMIGVCIRTIREDIKTQPPRLVSCLYMGRHRLISRKSIALLISTETGPGL